MPHPPCGPSAPCAADGRFPGLGSLNVTFAVGERADYSFVLGHWLTRRKDFVNDPKRSDSEPLVTPRPTPWDSASAVDERAERGRVRHGARAGGVDVAGVADGRGG